MILLYNSCFSDKQERPDITVQNVHLQSLAANHAQI